MDISWHNQIWLRIASPAIPKSAACFPASAWIRRPSATRAALWPQISPSTCRRRLEGRRFISGSEDCILLCLHMIIHLDIYFFTYIHTYMHALYVLLVTFGVIWIFLKYNKTVNEPFLQSCTDSFMECQKRNVRWNDISNTDNMYMVYVYIYGTVCICYIYILYIHWRFNMAVCSQLCRCDRISPRSPAWNAWWPSSGSSPIGSAWMPCSMQPRSTRRHEFPLVFWRKYWEHSGENPPCSPILWIMTMRIQWGYFFLFTSPCLSPIVLIFVSMGDYIARKTRLKKHRLDHRTTAKKNSSWRLWWGRRYHAGGFKMINDHKFPRTGLARPC